nr:unnamed protein product [Callosobruchus chinensis]
MQANADTHFSKVWGCSVYVWTSSTTSEATTGHQDSHMFAYTNMTERGSTTEKSTQKHTSVQTQNKATKTTTTARETDEGGKAFPAEVMFWLGV